MSARADMRSVLRDWIRKNGQDVDPALLTDTTPLIESGILDSLSIMELLLELEDGELDLVAASVENRNESIRIALAHRSREMDVELEQILGQPVG